MQKFSTLPFAFPWHYSNNPYRYGNVLLNESLPSVSELFRIFYIVMCGWEGSKFLLSIVSWFPIITHNMFIAFLFPFGFPLFCSSLWILMEFSNFYAIWLVPLIYLLNHNLSINLIKSDVFRFWYFQFLSYLFW